jgi:hypothetical protein
MAGVRIRWRGVARVAAAAVVGLIVLSLLPGLLRAPEPPPLGADVGLPRAKAARVVTKPEPQGAQPEPRPRRKVVPDEAASTAEIGTGTRRRRHHKKPPPPPIETPAEIVPEYAPSPAPEATPEPAYEPPPAPPSTPDDGSQEFAPH